MTESVKVVIGQWYYELRHIQEILCEPLTQLFLLRYSDSHGPSCDWAYYQRLSCVLLYHIRDVCAFQIRGNLALSHLNRIYYNGTCNATVTGVIFACFRPELLYYEPQNPISTPNSCEPIGFSYQKIPDWSPPNSVKTTSRLY